jgi:hypothetical protein
LTLGQAELPRDVEHQWVLLQFIADLLVFCDDGGLPTIVAVLVNFVAGCELRNGELFLTARTFLLSDYLFDFGDPRFLNVLVDSTRFNRGAVKELVRVILVSVTV